MARNDGQKLPDVLSENEVAAIVAVADAEAVRRERRYPTVMRNRILVQIGLYRCALRVSEACALRRRDIKWDEARLLVARGKGNKQRSIELDADSLAQLRLWDARRHSGETFFNTLAGKPLGRRYVERMVKRMAKRAKVANWEDVHPHTFRHSRATHLRRLKEEITKVQDLLGHKDVRTTMVYDHLANSEMREMMEKAAELLP